MGYLCFFDESIKACFDLRVLGRAYYLVWCIDAGTFTIFSEKKAVHDSTPDGHGLGQCIGHALASSGGINDDATSLSSAMAFISVSSS